MQGFKKDLSMERHATNSSIISSKTSHLNQEFSEILETCDPSPLNFMEQCSPSEIAVALETTETLLENCHESGSLDPGEETTWTSGTRKEHWISEWIRKRYRCYQKFVSNRIGAAMS